MTTLTVTATQGGSTGNGMLLRVFVITGANKAASQTGAATNQQVSASNTWTQSITTSAGSNVYGTAAPFVSGLTFTGSNATIVDQVSDGTNGATWATFKALNVTAGATVRGFTTTNTPTGPFAQLEILQATTLAEDGSAPAVVSTTGAGPLTTASFTPPGGSLLVALVTSNGGVAQTTFSLSNSGTALNWMQKSVNNPNGGDYAGVWIADIPSAGGGSPQSQPGQTWARQFHHRQFLPPAPAPAPAVSAFPWAELVRRPSWPRALLVRGKRVEVVPGQDVPFPLPVQKRQAWPRALYVRGKRFETVPAQVIAPPAYPWSELVRRQAWPRGLLIRGKRFETIPAQLNPPYPFTLIVPRRPHPRSLLVRGKRSEVVPPQDFPYPFIVPRRPYPRSLLARGKRFETIPAQLNPPYPFTLIRQWRGPRGWPTVRGHRFDPGWGQAAAAPPPPWVWQTAWRIHYMFRPRPGRSFEPGWPQAIAPPPIPPGGIPADQMTNSGGDVYVWVWGMGWIKLRRPPA